MKSFQFIIDCGKACTQRDEPGEEQREGHAGDDQGPDHGRIFQACFRVFGEHHCRVDASPEANRQDEKGNVEYADDPQHGSVAFDRFIALANAAETA